MLVIKKRFPAREMYLVAGVVTSIGVAGALAAIVSAHSLKDQSAVMPTKIIKAVETPKEDSAPKVATETPAQQYQSPTQRGVASEPTTSTTPIATAPAVSASPEPTPTATPEPTPEPSPEPSVEPES